VFSEIKNHKIQVFVVQLILKSILKIFLYLFLKYQIVHIRCMFLTHPVCVRCRLQKADAVEKGWVLDSLIETRQEAQTLSSLGVIPTHCGEQIFTVNSVCLMCRTAKKLARHSQSYISSSFINW